MKRKYDFFKNFYDLRALVKTQHSSVIKCFSFVIRVYISNDFSQLFTFDGIMRQTSYTGTLEHNGVAEKKHYHLVDI